MMKAISITEEAEIEPCDENITEPTGWVNNDGTFTFNEIDGGGSYTREELQSLANFLSLPLEV